MIDKIVENYLDRDNNFVGKLGVSTLAYQFFPKRKSFKSLDFEYEFASLEKSGRGKNLTLYVIYKEVKK